MNRAQHTPACKILLHPTACTPAGILALQHRTGMLVIISHRGFAQAVPAKGAA